MKGVQRVGVGRGLEKVGAVDVKGVGAALALHCIVRH